MSGIGGLMEETSESSCGFLFFWLCEDVVKRQLEVSPHQTLILLVP